MALQIHWAHCSHALLRSGTTEFISDEVAYPLPYTLTDADGADGHQWAQPSVRARCAPPRPPSIPATQRDREDAHNIRKLITEAARATCGDTTD